MQNGRRLFLAFFVIGLIQQVRNPAPSARCLSLTSA